MSEWFWKKLSYLTGLLAIGILFGLIIFAANIEIKDLDLWLHIATGRFIVQNQIIPQTDVLSFTMAGKPWVNHEWLFQVVLFLVYNLGGADGLINLQVLTVGITFVLLLLVGYNKERQLGPLSVLLLVLLVYQLRFTLRPDIFSLLFFTLYVFFLSFFIDRRWTLWILFFIQLLWTNIHGYFIIGPALVLLGIVCELIKRHVPLPFSWNHVGRLSDEEFRSLKRIFLFVALACLVNPYFLDGAIYPLKVISALPFKSEMFFKYINELQRPITWATFWQFSQYPHYRLLIVVSAASFLLNFRKIDVSALLVWLIFLLVSLSAVRNIVFFALASYFVFLANARFVTFGKFIPPNKRNFVYILSILFKVWLSLWMIGYLNQLTLRGYFDFDRNKIKSEYEGISLRNFSYKAVDFLVENNVSGNFFNDFNSGAYLLGRAHPQIKVFIDGRTEFFGEKFFQDYRKVWQGDSALFENMVQRYQLTGAFLNSVYVPVPAPLLKYLYKHDEWILVYFDYDAAIFLKDIPENQKWIEKFRMDLSHWEAPELDLVKLGVRHVIPYQHMNRAKALFNLGFFDKAFEEAQEALRATADFGEPYKILGKVFVEQGRYLTALENLRKAKYYDPQDAEVRYYLAVSFFYLDALDEAQEQCEQALLSNPENPDALLLQARICARKAMYGRSLEIIRNIYKADPERSADFLTVANFFVERQRFSEAREIYNMILENDLENQEILDQVEKIEEQWVE